MSAQLCCPVCGARLDPDVLPNNPSPVYEYEDCLRRCDACGVGHTQEKPSSFRRSLIVKASQMMSFATGSKAPMEVRSRKQLRRG